LISAQIICAHLNEVKTMWTYEHSLQTAAGPETIFEIFRDVSRWPEWNPGVERIDLDGPFATGTTGVMVIPDQGSLSFRLAWVGEGRGFEDETEIPGGEVVVRVRHSLEPLAASGTRITYRASVEGPSADALGPEIGPAVTADFPDVMAALAARAEARAAIA
jgi:polyketide cyclase/dehydrase/lipid transport protein